MTTEKKNTTPTIFGEVTVLFQRVLIATYFLMVLACLWAIDWQYFSWISFALVFYVGLLVADFVSGLVHLYIDYRPLNSKQGYDKLYHFRGDRGSDAYANLKRRVLQDTKWFDYTIYAFKVHHRDVGICLTIKYRDFFIATAVPCFIFLFCSLFVSAFFPKGPWSSYLAFFDVVFSVAALHSDVIHAWVHGSKTMPLGVKFINFFLKNKLMYSVKTHNLHHKDGLTGFCFVIGHTNFAVDWICKKLLERGVIYREDWYGLPRTQQSRFS